MARPYYESKKNNISLEVEHLLPIEIEGFVEDGQLEELTAYLNLGKRRIDITELLSDFEIQQFTMELIDEAKHAYEEGDRE